MPPVELDTYLPAAPGDGARRARGLRRRRILLLAGAVVVVAAIAGIVAASSGDGDGGPGAAGARRRATTSTRAGSTTSSAPSSTDTTDTKGTTGTGLPGSGATGTAGSGSATTAPPAGPEPEPFGLRVSEQPGACRFNPEFPEQLEDAGTVTNSGTVPASIEVSVTWLDGSGEELDFETAYDEVAPGESVAWDVSVSWDEVAPPGLRCEVTLASV